MSKLLKMLSVLVLLSVAGLGFVACSKDDDKGGSGGGVEKCGFTRDAYIDICAQGSISREFCGMAWDLWDPNDCGDDE